MTFKPGSKVSRREALAMASATFGTVATMSILGASARATGTSSSYSTRAIDLVDSSLVIDMLSIMAPVGAIYSMLSQERPLDGFELIDSQVELLLSMGVDVFHPSINVSGRDDAFSFVARLNAYAAERPDTIYRVDDIDDFERVREPGKIGFIIGIQNSDHLRTVDDVNRFYFLGQRVGQLIYDNRNRLGSGGLERNDGGLSHFGVQVVERMNEVGMAVDVSHGGDTTTLDACEVSQRPVFNTHTNARALNPGNPRCITDEAIKAIAKSGGVVGVTGIRSFVRNKEPTTVEHIVDHIDHIADLVGIEHVGVGSDIDPHGYDDMPEEYLKGTQSFFRRIYGFRDKLDTDGFDHPKRTYDLAEAMINRGYSDQHIRLVLGENFRRALGVSWSKEE